jgi:thiol:disulfide interchange protein DsbD
VFPLIPVTLAFFTKQVTTESGETKPGGVVKLAALYCLGIVLAFTAIGAVLAATVGAAGANQLASNPYVNLGFGVLFIVFALSLLEVIEIKPPAFLQKLTNGTNPNAAKSATTWGVLGMGLTFVIAAFTCTAPFIGTVLVAAASAQTGGQWVRPILGMTTFALALALPFFVLALFPSLLAKLPKSGAWLSTVKGAMGWIELAAAVKFLSGADQVFGWQLLNVPRFLALWAMVFLAGGFASRTASRRWGAPDAPATPLRG